MHRHHLVMIECFFILTCSLAFLPEGSTAAISHGFYTLQATCDPATEECAYLPLITVAVIPPPAFGKSSPADGSNDQPVTLTLSWGNSSGLTAYEYCLVEAGDACAEEDWVSTDTDTEVEVGELPRFTAYSWQVRAMNDLYSTEADGGTWWSFTTTATEPPAAFSKTDPEAGGSSDINAYLSWQAATGANHYEYCIDQVLNLLCDGSWINTDTANWAITTDLSYQTIYFWQVRAVNAGGITYADGGTWRLFVTIGPVPGSFSKSMPYDAQSYQPLDLMLTWFESTNADFYWYCINVVPSCSTGWIKTGLTSAEVTGLERGTMYFWQVQAVNSELAVGANNDMWWRFNTIPDPWNILTSYDFESASMPSGWTAYDRGEHGGVYYPARRNCDAYPGSFYSGWMIGGGTDGSMLSCGANYPNNAEAWLKYGPFSLYGVNAAYLTFAFRLQSNYYDYFKYLISSDNFVADSNGFWWQSTSGGWQVISMNLGDVYEDGTNISYLGKTAHIAFVFDSDPTSIWPEGAYVDNIDVYVCSSPSCPEPPPYYSPALNPLAALYALLDPFLPGFSLPGPIPIRR